MTRIEWTDETWNPVVGCSPVSPGCLNCYAASMAVRLQGMGVEAYRPALVEGDEAGADGVPEVREVRIAEVRADAQGRRRAVFTGEAGAVRAVASRLLEPLGWKRPRRVFVCSMADLFHEAVEADFIAQVFAVMALTPRHTYQVLTKRPGRMARIVGGSWFRGYVRAEAAALAGCVGTGVRFAPEGWPLGNVWLGTSVEDQRRADERIPELLNCPAVVRFLSCEPLLGPVDLGRWLGVEPSDVLGWMRSPWWYTQPRGLHWIIAGGESGAHARPMHPAWAEGLRDQCAAAGVPFFFKQWGEWRPAEHGPPASPRWGVFYRDGSFVEHGRMEHGAQVVFRVGKKLAGRVLDWKVHDGFPAVD